MVIAVSWLNGAIRALLRVWKRLEEYRPSYAADDTV